MRDLLERVVWWITLIFETSIVCVYLILELFKQLYFLIAGREMKDVRGSTALVTGAARGLGRELALEFARKGCSVVCVDILTKENEETAEEIKILGQKSIAYTCDITKRDEIVELASQVGNIDILVNNAGLVYFDPILETLPNMVTRLLDVNVASHFWVIQAFLPGMLERKQGHIVAIASLAGLEGLAGASLYSTSKHAVIGLMRTLELELHSESHKYIKTTTICPYFIDTINDVKFGIKSRLSHLEPKEAAHEIIIAVLKELPEVTIPGYLSPLIAFNSILPKQVQYMFRDVFYARVLPRKTTNNFTEEHKCQKLYIGNSRN